MLTTVSVSLVQGKSLVSLNTSSVNEDGRPLDLSQYPNLEKLFLHCDTLSMDNASALKPSPPVSFSSKEVAHLKRLQVLSLRAFTTLDLRFLPPSIQVRLNLDRRDLKQTLF